jgi:hypothetical protein
MTLTRSTRLVLAAYCLLVAYCLLWIPWCVSDRRSSCERVGYGWLWAGPSPKRTVKIDFSRYVVPPPPPGFILDNPDPEPTWERARPDRELVTMRLVAASVVGGAALLLASISNRPADSRSVVR